MRPLGVQGGLPWARPGGRAPAAGFTLLEALTASAIFAIVMTAVYLMYESNQAIFLSGEARAGAQQNARIALDDLAGTVRMAGAFHPHPLCRPAGSGEAVRIAADDTLSLHAGYREPNPAGGPNQDCNVYVTYSLWSGGGVRDTTLRKETRRDDWGLGQLVEAPLAEDVTRLAFRYFDAHGHSLPTNLPAATTPNCPGGFPWARPRGAFGLDGQGPVATGTTPSPVPLGSQRDLVRTVRIELTVETNIAFDPASGCFRRGVGGPTQAFTLVSEAHLRGLTP